MVSARIEVRCGLRRVGIRREGQSTMNVLVVDIGGSHVKLALSSDQEHRKLDSEPEMTPQQLVALIKAHTRDWDADVVTIGFPGAVGAHGPRFEPGNLGSGWVGFSFEQALGKPVRVVNDAVMQAIGAYEGGRMLFLGLGTGLGSALITDHVAVYMDLGNRPWADGRSLGERLGREGLEAAGDEQWQRFVTYAVDMLRHAFVADYVVLGGGNAKRMTTLPHDCRLGGNQDAFVGGRRIWEELIDPRDLPTGSVWRIVR